jgi:hypothetical protein
MCQNIDDFNRGCALIMARLYKSFPQPVILDIAGIDGGEDLFDEEKAGRLSDRLGVYIATVQFLADEGYLIFRQHDGCSGFSGARLTSKGLAALNRVPEALRPPQKTLGDRLIAITTDLSGAAGKEAVKTAVQAMLA